MANEPTFPLFALSRHRMASDGQGVTTLAAAWGCPLRCRYCLNPQSWAEGTPVRPVTARALYDLVRIDDLYFRATNGGVTFGGGEPLAHAAFIRAFRAVCGDGWRLSAETCLNAPAENVAIAMECLDEFIVDVKDADPDIYRRYTGADNARALDNLRAVLETLGPDRVLVRVPNIPDFNTPDDVARSLTRLRALGATRFDVFDYIVRKE